MITYTLKFKGEEFELYCNAKLSSKKIKQDEWFILEPQSFSFDVYKYSYPQNGQQEISNSMIYNIFIGGIVIDGEIIQNSLIQFYEDSQLVFTGYVSATQSKRNIIEGKATIFCYDFLGILKNIKDNDVQIIDNYRSLTSFVDDYLQQIFDDKGYMSSLSIDNSANPLLNSLENVSIAIKPEYRYDPANSNNFIYYGFRYYPGTSGPQPAGSGWGTVYFAYAMAEEIDPFSQTVGNSILYDYFLLRFDGLYYCEIFRKSGSKDAGNNPSEMLDSIRQEMDVEFAEYLDLTLEELFAEVYTYTTGGTRAYSFNWSNLQSAVIFNGQMSSLIMSCGRYVNDGYNEENTSNIIDVLKMYLMVNDLICYARDDSIIIKKYSDYDALAQILDADLLSISEYRNKPGKEIDSVETIDQGDDTYWIRELNNYYFAYFDSRKTYNLKILKDNYIALKVGWAIFNPTYISGNLLVIEIKENLGKGYIEVTGVSI